MFSIPAVTWTLTTVLLLSASYHFLQATRSRQLTDQVNQSLHAIMHVLMAAMLWNLAPSTMLAQIAVLTGAALWFIIQAVARPEFKALCAHTRGRLKCVYHSLTMGGAALMISMMAHVTTPGYGLVPSDGMSAMSMSHDHHAMRTPVQIRAAATPNFSPDLAILLTVFFGAATVIFIILLLRFRTTKTPLRNTTAPRLSHRAEHGLEALGAAVMALMFATMTA
ncbi:DUF5134 domain-containing protein [Arthrobacter sp. H14-L1]|uniref:DUF5134 domain-containing protein n=2 Tax=Arthrobacter sp. H14-L1 TaxID=2996697 RepID=UPI00226FE1EA|nr:DUF5134 domain-containing protein [Arthrobacter sp. H14-L1]MCY0906692.1 DUF5134 domain-containing protein [Arthrobacter sp. H14-L1]